MSRSTKSTDAPLHPAIEALAIALARHLAREHRAGRLPPLDAPPATGKRSTLPAKRKAA